MLHLTGHSGAIYALAFAADGGRLFSAGKDATVRIWNTSRGAEAAVLQGHGGPVYSLAFHHEGKMLASGGADKVPLLWDLSTAALIKPLAPQMSSVTGLAWLPGRTTLVAASGERLRPERGGEIKVVYHDGPHAAPRLDRLEAEGVWSLAVSAKGPTLAWAGGAPFAFTWDITRQEPRLMRQQDQCLALGLSPDGRLLAAASRRTVKLWDVGRGLEVAFLEGHRGTVRAVAFSPDGRTLATGGLDKIVRLWSVGDGVHLRGQYEWPIGAVHAITFSPDGLLAAAAGDQGPIVVWDLDE